MCNQLMQRLPKYMYTEIKKDDGDTLYWGNDVPATHYKVTNKSPGPGIT